MVELCHSVLTKFLKGQLLKGSQDDVVQNSRKKRHYNNSRRAAAAEHAKRMKSRSDQRTRVPRNSEETRFGLA